MELAPWKLDFREGWDKHFRKFDKSVQRQILKKLEQMKRALAPRGLHSSNYSVEEVGQYRISFIQDDETRTKKIHFIGNHKQYEKWYRGEG